MTIPSDITIDGVRGYGPYTVSALWKLEVLDHKEKGLLSQSMEEALGIPIPWIFDASSLHDEARGFDAIALVRRMVSFPALRGLADRSYRTTVPFWTYLTLVWNILFLRVDQFTLLTVDRSRVSTEETLPDGTTMYRFDPSRIDAVIGHAFEDERIRRESLRVSVLNTTQTSTLGTRVGRLLGHKGAIVVNVGNQLPETDRCILLGSEKNVSSITAKFILYHYHCIAKVTQEEGSADLEIRIGSQYARRFLPVL